MQSFWRLLYGFWFSLFLHLDLRLICFNVYSLKGDRQGGRGFYGTVLQKGISKRIFKSETETSS